MGKTQLALGPKKKKLTSSKLISSTCSNNLLPIAASILSLSNGRRGRNCKMTPPCHSFPASELPLRIQVDPHGRRRKHDPSTTTHKVDLSACELLQMLQYKCHVQTPLSGNGVVRCFPVERLFRRYVGFFLLCTVCGGEGRGGR